MIYRQCGAVQGTKGSLQQVFEELCGPVCLSKDKMQIVTLGVALHLFENKSVSHPEDSQSHFRLSVLSALWPDRTNWGGGLPAQVCDEEAQSPVVGCGQLLEKVSDPEDDSVELDTRPSLLLCCGALKLIHLLHDHPLALFGQANEVVVVAVQDQWLRELETEAEQPCVILSASGEQWLQQEAASLPQG